MHCHWAMMLGALGSIAAPVAAARDSHVYVGTQDSDIRLAQLNERSGALTVDGPAGKVPRPTWVVRHPRLPILYAANDERTADGRNGTIVTFRINPASGALTPLSDVDAGGQGTTYLSVDTRSRTLFAANFGSGSVTSFPILPDGRIGPAASVVAATGSGPHRRQASPHAHSVALDPSGRFVLVADLGADRVFVYPFDRRTHRILTDPAGKERHVTLPPGSGPRHFAFHPRGRFLYLVSELTAQVLVFAWDAGAGRLTLLESLSTNAPDHRGDSSASEILASADGRFLYVGNRGDNRLVVYAIDARSGRLSLVQRIGAGGETPWSFAFAAKGRWLLVGNLKSDRISVFGVDRRTGRLSDSGRSAAAPKPTSFSVYP